MAELCADCKNSHVHIGKDKTLIAAAKKGHDQCTSILIQKGADVNSTDKTGITALMAAVWKGHDTCVNVLLSAGANVNAVDKSGETALTKALDNRREKGINFLREIGRNGTFSKHDIHKSGTKAQHKFCRTIDRERSRCECGSQRWLYCLDKSCR